MVHNVQRRRYAIAGALALVACFACGYAVSAAGTSPELYFTATAQSFSPGSEFTIGVFMSADKPVNAVDIEIGYSAQTLEFLGFNTSHSVVDAWREQPEVLSVGIIRFRGGLLQPFEGRAGEILGLNFRVRDGAEGTLQLSFRKGDMLYADGAGTRAGVTLVPLVVPVNPGAPLSTLTKNSDVAAPIITVLRAVKNPIDTSSYFAVWQATDNDSGVKDAHIRTRRWFFWGPWETASNPVLLPGGTWAFEIQVSDSHGNSAYGVAHLWPVAITKGIITCLTVLVLAVLAVIVRRSRFRR